MEKKRQKKASPAQPFPGVVNEQSQKRSIVIGITLSILTVLVLYFIGMFLSDIILDSDFFFIHITNAVLIRFIIFTIVFVLIILAIISYFGEKRFLKIQQEKSLELHNKEFNERRVKIA